MNMRNQKLRIIMCLLFVPVCGCLCAVADQGLVQYTYPHEARLFDADDVLLCIGDSIDIVCATNALGVAQPPYRVFCGKKSKGCTEASDEWIFGVASDAVMNSALCADSMWGMANKLASQSMPLPGALGGGGVVFRAEDLEARSAFIHVDCGAQSCQAAVPICKRVGERAYRYLALEKDGGKANPERATSFLVLFDRPFERRLWIPAAKESQLVIERGGDLGGDIIKRAISTYRLECGAYVLKEVDFSSDLLPDMDKSDMRLRIMRELTNMTISRYSPKVRDVTFTEDERLTSGDGNAFIGKFVLDDIADGVFAVTRRDAILKLTLRIELKTHPIKCSADNKE